MAHCCREPVDNISKSLKLQEAALNFFPERKKLRLALQGQLRKHKYIKAANSRAHSSEEGGIIAVWPNWENLCLLQLGLEAIKIPPDQGRADAARASPLHQLVHLPVAACQLVPKPQDAVDFWERCVLEPGQKVPEIYATKS